MWHYNPTDTVNNTGIKLNGVKSLLFVAIAKAFVYFYAVKSGLKGLQNPEFLLHQTFDIIKSFMRKYPDC